ncbi:MAG: helix-turn-helix domain-containing protein [Acidimicrobiales bacterium]
MNRTTDLGHVRRHGVPKRGRRALQGDEADRAAQLYAEGHSADWVAERLGVAASTVRRVLREAGITMRPGGRQRRDDSTVSSPLNITEQSLSLGPAPGQRAPTSFPGRRR